MTVYNKASLVLAESPAYKAGKIQPYYPLTPDVSFDFTRATSATRVNASGNIEKETQNLLLQSNQFDTTWGNVGTTESSGESGYDGSSDAWLLTKDANGFRYIHQDISSSGVQTFSVYAKANTLEQVTLYVNATANTIAKFSLVDGSLVYSLNLIDYNAEDIGNGWYRLSIVVNDSITRVRIYTDYQEATAGSIYIQDAQLEQGLVARNYQETTTAAFYGGITDNIPRLDYTDSSCPALLLEPQRTNLLSHSEYIASWQSIGSITLTANYGTSPEGVQNSTRVQFSGASQEVREAATSLTGCVASIYVKGTSGETIKFGSSGSEELFTLNGSWQRIDKYNSGIPTNITINTYSGATARDIEVWGAQVEQASYATSYIPTYGTSVTREADGELYKDLAANNFIGDTFSIFFEIDNVNYGTANSNFNYLNSSIGGSAMYVYGSTLGIHTTTGDDYSTFLQGFTNPKGGKFLAVYNGSNVKIYKDGSLYRTISNPSARWDNVTIYRLRMYSATATSSYKSLMIFPTALSDDECIALTTL